MARGPKPPIPLTIVAGARGAGKTTLINRLLADSAFAHTAVILNDFGEVAVTGGLVSAAEDGYIALGSGCVCCAVRGALTDSLETLLRDLDNHRLERLDRVVIEADAKADPNAILGAVLAHPYLSLRYVPDGIVTVLDASSAAFLLASNKAAVDQVASADVVLTSRSGGADIPESLRALNPTAAIEDAATVDPRSVAGHGLFDPALDDADLWLAAPAEASARLEGEAARIRVFALQRDGAIPFAALERFLEYLVALQGPNLIRVRGLVSTTDGEAASVEGLGTMFRPPAIMDWPGPPAVRLAMTTRDLDAATVAAYLDAFLNQAQVDTPDRAALTDNPLAIAGFSARTGKR